MKCMFNACFSKAKYKYEVSIVSYPVYSCEGHSPQLIEGYNATLLKILDEAEPNEEGESQFKPTRGRRPLP